MAPGSSAPAQINVTSAGRLPAGGRNRRQLKIVLFLVAAACLCVVILAYPATLFGSTRARAETTTVAIAIFSFVAVTRVSTRSWRSLPAVFIVVFTIFHAGIAFVEVLNLPMPARRAAQIEIWFDQPTYVKSQLLVSTALIAMAIGAAVASLLPPRGLTVFRGHEGDDRDVVGAVGSALLIVGILVWAWIVIHSLGVDGFLASYDEYRVAVAPDRSTIYGLALELIGLGLAFSAAGRMSTLGRMGLCAYGLFAVVALPLGLRGEVLFPLAAALPIYARQRHRRIELRRVIAFIAVCLPLLTLINVTRSDRNDLTVTRSLDPTDAIIEMGTTVRVPVEGLRMLRTGYEFEWLQVIRDSTSFFGENLTVVDEDRDRIGDRINEFAVGPSGIGSSSVAEFYLSGGLILLAGYYLLLGAGLTLIDRLRSNAWNDAFVGVIFFALIVSVRNEFVFVPLHWVVGTVLLIALYTQRRTLRHLVRG